MLVMLATACLIIHRIDDWLRNSSGLLHVWMSVGTAVSRFARNLSSHPWSAHDLSQINSEEI